MKEYEILMTDLLNQSLYDNIPLVEVVSNYCVDHDIDPKELIKMFDESFMHQLKTSAYDNNIRLTSSFKNNRKTFF